MQALRVRIRGDTCMPSLEKTVRMCPRCRSEEVEKVEGGFGELQCMDCGLAFTRSEALEGVESPIP